MARILAVATLCLSFPTFGKATTNLIAGTAGDDVKFGTVAADDMYMYGGDDFAFASPGNDFVLGGSGVDHLYGGPGNDVLGGSEGADFLYGGDGFDDLVGAVDAIDTGVDVEHGGNGHDSLAGGGGNDRLFGEVGNDGLFGGGGDDYLALGPHGPLAATSALPASDIHRDPGYEIVEPNTGKDTMVLSPVGKGKDVVKYFGSDLLKDHASLPSASFDVIKNFDAAQDFVNIGLGGLAKSQFTSDATAKEFLFLTVSGTKKKVFRIVNGDVPALITAKKITFF